MTRAGSIAAAFLIVTTAASSWAAPPSATPVAIDGHVEHALQLTIADLRAMPQQAIDVTFTSGKGPQSDHFTGALLWDVVQKAGIADGADAVAKHHLQHVVLVSGRDGYTVAVSIGEIDPAFEGKSVILVDDDADKGVRLVVPGDKRGGRNVRDVVRIDIE